MKRSEAAHRGQEGKRVGDSFTMKRDCECGKPFETDPLRPSRRCEECHELEAAGILGSEGNQISAFKVNALAAIVWIATALVVGVTAYLLFGGGR